MATPDIRVHDLTELIQRLTTLKGELQGALRDEDRMAGKWGQLNANLSMGDFADNWTDTRYRLEQDMEKFIKNIEEVERAWAELDAEMAETLETKQP